MHQGSSLEHRVSSRERKGSAAALFPQRFAILTPCIKDSLLTPGSQRVTTHNLCVRISFASSLLPTKILQLKIPQMHKNTIKSAIVTHDNSTMLLPHCNANLLPVNNIQPWRVKFKTSNPHQPSSLDRGDHPITKYTTFNTEIAHAGGTARRHLYAGKLKSLQSRSLHLLTLPLPTAVRETTQLNTSPTGTLYICAFFRQETPVRSHCPAGKSKQRAGRQDTKYVDNANVRNST